MFFFSSGFLADKSSFQQFGPLQCSPSLRPAARLKMTRQCRPRVPPDRPPPSLHFHVSESSLLISELRRAAVSRSSSRGPSRHFLSRSTPSYIHPLQLGEDKPSTSALEIPSAMASDPFDLLPDALLLLIFSKTADVKALARCSAVSRRFLSLARQADDVLVRVDCVFSSEQGPDDSSEKPPGLLSDFLSLVLRPLHAIKSKVFPRAEESAPHLSPAEALRSFSLLRHLKIELAAGELSLKAVELVKWRAEFGATLQNCVVLGADSRERTSGCLLSNGRLKRGVGWAISALIAASARHYLVYPVVAEHDKLEGLEAVDGELQGRLVMGRRQVEEMREKPVKSGGERTLVPAVKLELWFAPQLELPGGVVLKGATMIAIRPGEGTGEDDGWMRSAFEEPYATAVSLLLKRRKYCLEMNSF